MDKGDNLRKRQPTAAMVARLLIGATAIAPLLMVVGGAAPPGFAVVSTAVLLTVLVWHLRTQAPAILLVFLSVLMAGSVISQPWPTFRESRINAEDADDLARGWRELGAFDVRLPIVLHLVFDELMSLGAMTADLPGGQDSRESWRRLGDQHGFRMFDAVYSRHFFSAESLPNMLNPGYLGKTGPDEILVEPQVDYGTNAYFDDLSARGYRTAVFQTSHMDFCSNERVQLCETFPSFDPGGWGSDGLTLGTRTANLWRTILRAYAPSYAALHGRRVVDRVFGVEPRQVGVEGEADRYDVQRFPDWFDRFVSFAAQAPRGSHLFAHFMVPHAPYLLTGNCNVEGHFESGYYLAQRFPGDKRESMRRHYYERYFQQLHCVRTKIEELLRRIDAAPEFRDATVIIHGDHGSRISNGNILEDLRERDFVDNYGTFFAVRSPGARAGVDCAFTSLSEAFRRQMRPSDPSTGLAGTPLPVLVISRAAGAHKVEAPMPRFGCAASTSPDDDQ